MKIFICTIAFIHILVIESFCQDTLKTVLVKDIKQSSSHNASENSSWPGRFAILQDKLMFLASIGNSNFYDLWATDGTNEGTVRLTAANSFYSPVVINGLTVWGTKIIYTANDGYLGYEPWISDGTSENTRMIKDIKTNNPNYSSVDSSEPRYFKIFNDKAYFQADTWGGRQLFVTDGTSDGTVMLTTNGNGGSEPSGFIAFNNKLFFAGQKSYGTAAQLWVTDGTVDGTYEFKAIGDGDNGYLPTLNSAIVYKNKLYFSASIDSLGSELWVSDGTNSGTQLFKNINETEGIGSQPHGFKIFKDNLYFIADDGIHGNELWCTNGDSTYLVKDIFLNGGGLDYSDLYVLQNKLFFTARQDDNELYSQLWVSNGTADSTMEILSNDGKEIDYASSFIEWKGKIVFVSGRYNKQLWITDGTSQNTYPALPDSITKWNALGSDASMVNFKGDLYFGANYNDSIGYELYKLEVDSNLIRPNISQHPLSTNICIDDSAFFEVKVSGRPDFKFQWMRNDIPIDGATMATYKISNTGTEDSGNYSCFIKNSVGEITSNSASLEVYELSSRFEVIDSTEYGFYFIKFTGSAPASAIYEWDFNEGEIISGSGQGPYHVAWKSSGQKNITLRVMLNNCVAETSIATEIISTVHIPTNILSPLVSNYPNPVKSNLTLIFNESAGGKTISLFDVYGHIVFEKQTEEIRLNLNLSKITSGVYYLRVQDDRSSIIKKIIKE